MSDDTKKQSPLMAPETWSMVASGYDEITRPFLAQFSEAGLRRLELAASHRLVDVACGPGTTALLAAQRVRHVDALDFSSEMLLQARANVEKDGHDNIELHEGDAQALPFLDQAYERATCMFGLMFFPDRKKAMRELHRVLGPGGKMLASSWAPVDASPYIQALMQVIAVFDPDVTAPQADWNSLENPEVFAAELREAGFEDVVVESPSFADEFASADSFLDAMLISAAPLLMLKTKLGARLWEEREPLARARVRELFEAPYSLSATAHLAWATRR